MKITAFFSFFFILIAFSVSAQYEKISGIDEASGEYENYKSCVNSCEQCELNCKEALLQQAAESKQDEAFCLQLTGEIRKTFCLDSIYRIKALTLKEKSFCDKISKEDEKQQCTLSVQIGKAIEKESEAECNSLPENFIEGCKISFYNSMAISKQDKSYCSNLQEPARSTCISSAEAAIGFTATAAPDMQETTEGLKEKVTTNVTSSPH